MARRNPALTRLNRLAVLCGGLVVAACAATAPKPTPPAQPSLTIPIAPPPAPPGSGNPNFDAFLAEARKTALIQGITPATFNAATAGIAPIASIATMNANQPEFSKPVWSYLDSAVSARRIADAKLMLARYGDVLAKIEASSGVPKEILVAIWGMESDFGADSGSFNLFAALATLAYDGPRADYARPEFLAALKLYQDQHYPLSEMVGVLGGCLRPDPVHAQHLFQIRRRWRWRRQDRSVDVARPMRWHPRRAFWQIKDGGKASPGAMKSSCPKAFRMKPPTSTRKRQSRNGGRWG